MKTSHKMAVGLVVLALIFVGFRMVGHFSNQSGEQQPIEQQEAQSGQPQQATGTRAPGGGVFPGIGSESDWKAARAIAHQSADAIRAHDFDTALTLGQQAIEKYPNDPDFQNNTAYALMLRDQPGDAVKAEALLRQAIALNSNDARYWDNLGRVLVAQNKTAEARDAFSKALKSNPNPKQAAELEQNLKQLDAAAAAQPATQ